MKGSERWISETVSLKDLQRLILVLMTSSQFLKKSLYVSDGVLRRPILNSSLSI